jgi:hypothetical protein
VVILSISVFVGLNPQQPVQSITIIDSFLGLTIGIVIAAVVGRLIWPVLPQELFRDDLLKFFFATEGALEPQTAYGKNSDPVGNSAGRSPAGSASNANRGILCRRTSENQPADQGFASAGDAERSFSFSHACSTAGNRGRVASGIRAP